MPKYYVGQTVLSKIDNMRCIIGYVYDNVSQEREYRIVLDTEGMKIVKENDLAPIANTYSASDFKRFSFSSSEQDYIRRYKIYYLFHFTHRNNLDQILRRGLLSKNKLAAEKIQYTSIADEGVQQRRSSIDFHLYGRIHKPIHDCVPLYISWRTPTLYKVLHEGAIVPQDIVYILVNIYSILRKNYCFTDGNAASDYTKQYVLISNLDKLDWNAIKSDQWEGDREKKRKKNSEFLVYPKVEIRDFYKLIVYDDSVKNEVENLLRASHLDLEVNADTRYYEWPRLF